MSHEFHFHNRRNRFARVAGRFRRRNCGYGSFRQAAEVAPEEIFLSMGLGLAGEEDDLGRELIDRPIVWRVGLEFDLVFRAHRLLIRGEQRAELLQLVGERVARVDIVQCGAVVASKRNESRGVRGGAVGS